MGETESTSTHFCFYHPNTATELRCNRCGKYICVRDAVRTPVGYRCRDCVRTQQGIFFNSLPADYIIAALIAFPIAYIAGLIVPHLFWLAVFAGPVVGGVISEGIRIATKKRRGRYIWMVAMGCMLLATLITIWPQIQILFSGRVGLISPVASSFSIDLIIDAIYVVLCGGTLIARLRFGEKI